MGGKGGGGSAPMMLPPQQQDNTELMMAMMQNQQQQNQQMMQAMMQMAMANNQQQQPVVIQPPQTAQKAEYQPQNFDATRDRLNEKAKQNVSDEANQRVGRSRTIVSSPRLDKTKPKTTADRKNKTLLTDDDEDKNS